MDKSKLIIAIDATHKDANSKGLKKGKGGVSSLKCPLCENGTINYSVAGVNGHIHGCCTNKCISWME